MAYRIFLLTLLTLAIFAAVFVEAGVITAFTVNGLFWFSCFHGGVISELLDSQITTSKALRIILNRLSRDKGGTK